MTRDVPEVVAGAVSGGLAGAADDGPDTLGREVDIRVVIVEAAVASELVEVPLDIGRQVGIPGVADAVLGILPFGDAEPEEAVVLRGTDGGYETLATGVDVDDGVVSITAETSGFSPFVVTNAQETPTPTDEETPTPTDEETPTPTDEETPTDEPDAVDTATPPETEDQPGFGIGIAIVALLGSMLLLARLRDGRE